MVLGIIAATNPLHVKPVTLPIGIAAWFADLCSSWFFPRIQPVRDLGC